MKVKLFFQPNASQLTLFWHLFFQCCNSQLTTLVIYNHRFELSDSPWPKVFTNFAITHWFIYESRHRKLAGLRFVYFLFLYRVLFKRSVSLVQIFKTTFYAEFHYPFCIHFDRFMTKFTVLLILRTAPC